MSVAQDIQRAMNTTAKQVMADAPYDKSRTGMVVGYDEATNTYSVIVDRVTYEKIPIVNGLKASANDIVKVVYPTNNISQMYINSICPLDKIKFYLPIDATEIITPNIILYDDGTNSRALTGYPSGELNWGGTPISLQGHTHTNQILEIFYPVGSYYETSDANFNPNTAWGGTWVLEEEGLVHIGSGANYAIGATGGEKTHNHLYRIRYGMNYGAVTSQEPVIRLYDYETNQYIMTDLSDETANIVNAGNQNDTRIQTHGISVYEAHTSSGNNLPPYTVVNRWHRTA